MIGLSYLLLFLLTTSAAKQCVDERDVNIILEIPQTGREEALKEAKIFIEILARKAIDSCWRPRIRVADSELYTINTFDCYSLQCMSDGVKSLDSEVEENEQTAKDNVIQALEEIKREAENSVGIPGMDGPRKIILLILSSKPKGDVSTIPGRINQLLETGYDFIAIGVGDGRYEALDRIAFQKNRIVRLDRFSQLNTEDEENKNDDIIFILDNPDEKDPEEERQSVVQRDSFIDLDGVRYNEVCSFIADICFLIDSSGSIREDTNYQIMKEFVIRIANRFNISENGARASAVVFSDRLPYTKISIKLNDHLTNKGFQQAIEKIPYMGYRTRIDLAFHLAKDVFTVENGARPNISKIAFLLTDGNQNPAESYDPLVRAKELADLGVKIFAVGITEEIDQEALESLTGEADRVFYADNFNTLESNEFLKKISAATCKAGSLAPPVIKKPEKENVTTTAASTTTTPPTTPTTPEIESHLGIVESLTNQTELKGGVNCDHTGCTGVGSCSTCCGGHDVYINIFQGGSGPSYLMQGLKLQQSTGGSLTGVRLPSKAPKVQINKGGSKYSIDDLIRIVQGALPNRPKLVRSIEQLVKTSRENLHHELPTSALNGIPSLAAKRQKAEELTDEKKRRRRSVDMDIAKLTVSKLAKEAGCNLFLTALKKHGILHEIDDLLKNEKHVAIFCPIDASYEKIYGTKSLVSNERNILLNHIAFKHDKYGIMYKTLLPGGKIVFNPVGKSEGKVSWKVNGVDVIISLTDGVNSEIILTKDVIYPKTRGIADVLKSNKNLSVFYEIIRKSYLEDIFKTKDIKKICFAKHTCVPITQSMQEHLKDAMSFNQFTILAPTNTMFANMGKAKFTSLMNDPKIQKEFLQEHVFLGSLGDQDNHHRGIAYSLSPNHSLLMMNTEKNVKLLVQSDNRLLQVKRSIPVTEGILYIVEKMA